MEQTIISVLIPVYNWDISLLIKKLIDEIKEFDLPEKIEIILVDDGSNNAIKETNRWVTEVENINLKYKELPYNTGRAKVRNILIGLASGKYILFLDTDGLPDREDFLSQYLLYAQSAIHDVVCGGRSYKHRILWGKEYEIYLYLSQKTEVKPSEERNKEPWRYIFTSNVMVRKSVIEDEYFDERFINWGYEDIEWAIRIVRKYKIHHIDNPVSHLGLKTKDSIYKQLDQSAGNYALLAKLHPDYFEKTPIAKWVNRLKGFNRSVLKSLHYILKHTYDLNGLPVPIYYYIIQLNKAVCLTMELTNVP